MPTPKNVGTGLVPTQEGKGIRSMQQNISSPQIDLLRRSKEEIRAIQDQRFRHQIDLCFKAHPYYQEIFASLHLKPDDFQTLADIHKIPPITKQDYMKNPQAFRLNPLPDFLPHERVLWDRSYTIRTIELVKIKGTLIDPDVIKEAIATVDGIEEYQIVFTKERPDDPYSQDKLLVRVAAPADEQAHIKTQLTVKVAEAAEMRPSIEFVGMSEIFDPAKTLKSTRVIDLRPTEAE
jgi:phenylacetate-coenzyme A ligase PaaK-like adenylate-forming protein